MDQDMAVADRNDAAGSCEAVAEALLALLKRKGVDYLFINSGTDAAPIAEAYARQHLSGLDFPAPVINVICS